MSKWAELIRVQLGPCTLSNIFDVLLALANGLRSLASLEAPGPLRPRATPFPFPVRPKPQLTTPSLSPRAKLQRIRSEILPVMASGSSAGHLRKQVLTVA